MCFCIRGWAVLLGSVGLLHEMAYRQVIKTDGVDVLVSVQVPYFLEWQPYPPFLMKLIFPLQLTSKNVLISLSNSTTLFTHDRVKEHLNNDYSSVKKHIPTWQGTISNESIDIKIIVHRKRDRLDLKHFLYRLPLSPLEPLNPKPLYSFFSHPSVQNRPRRGLPDRWFWKHRIPRARQLQTDAELYQVHR